MSRSLSCQEMSNSCFNEVKYDLRPHFDMSEEEMAREVQKLHDWLESQPHLPHDIDSTTLQKFLLSSKLSKEKSKEKLEAYFTARRLVPYIFLERDPLLPEIKENNACVYLGFLPVLTSEGARCVIIKLRDSNPDMFDLTSFLRRWFFLMDVWMKEDNFVNRIHVVVDTVNSSVKHMMKMSPKKIRDNVRCFQDVYPIGLEGITFLNTKPFVKIVLEKVLKPLLKEKISRRFFVYSDEAGGILTTLPVSAVPAEYGGNQLGLEEINDKWISEVERNRDWLMKQGSSLPDESKRIRYKGVATSRSCDVM